MDNRNYAVSLRPLDHLELLPTSHVVSLLAETKKKKEFPARVTLFSGPPGMGKTTVVRIIASILLELNKEDKERAKKNPDFAPRKYTSKDFGGSAKPSVGYSGWKVGAYEITTEQHGDIAYLYTIDMEKETVRVECPYNKESKSTYTYEQFINTDFSQNEHGEEQF